MKQLKLILGATMAAGLVCGSLAADSELKDEKSKVSYGVGMNIGQNLKRSGFEVDVDVLAGAIKDAIADKAPKMTETEAREVITAYQQNIRAKREEERGKIAETNRKTGEAFLAENKKKAGVKTKEVTLPDGTKAELQYEIVKEGTGTSPGPNDNVKVEYRGTLIDGKEFDSSAKHGQPGSFSPNRVIPGWREALQMMQPGAKWKLYVPSQLAYGDAGQGPVIEPGSTLIFDVELLSVEAVQPPPPAQPLTSDIIRVPSADELKKGAKVEVLKAEDVERMAREATNKPAAK
jgi:FKBP-type peptidyl-prolyl cis-trans isomerase FklB